MIIVLFLPEKNFNLNLKMRPIFNFKLYLGLGYIIYKNFFIIYIIVCLLLLLHIIMCITSYN